ncbi:DUF4175 domain-containing protein [Arenimonas fontis]|uniref:DUF4175 domain-containing protein n=1 Tax=Arenimonas fontis TaxID=2608255 RepID=A0A5B2ZAK6_9GAMM|nr:DUF4175 domain-containing protein [Arenimonas fontis]KAA2285059.1 DUF4175 domain-containing protein [Arenimonas fontis]
MMPLLAHALAAARRRAAMAWLLGGLPPLALLAWLGLRADGGRGTLLALAVALPLLAFLAWRAWRIRDPAWAARRLDRRPDMEDSADLLLMPPARPSPLQSLQAQRLAERLRAQPPELREPWPWRALLTSLAGTALCTLAVLHWPAADTGAAATPAPTAEDVEAAATALLLSETELRVMPPAYTGLPAEVAPELSRRVPAGSRLTWRLRLRPQPESLRLRWHDGRELALRREGEDWLGETTIERSGLYRLVAGHALPLAADRLHRIDVVADRPPEIRAIAPERTLSLREDGQRHWRLAFEASDDHGLGQARLHITLAQGSGEQVSVSERQIAVRGEGDTRARRYVHRLDLAALGLAQGDDLIVRLEVADNRRPAPQWSRSASFVLRWPPPPAAEATGMEGLIERALPAYFRSQRQIIIDTEALIAQRGRLRRDSFVSRSDAIGVDQRLLRLRYGQFMGEEDEGWDAEARSGDHEGGHQEEEHPAGDGHDHGEGETAPLGGAVSALEEFGHTHDDAEAATLLDPETRALLRQALNAMWSSESELRRGQPEQALPHAYRALDFIKQVQQASRIYLARVGLELPPVDESRRLTGKREGIASRRHAMAPAQSVGGPTPALWQALDGGDPTQPLQDFARWLGGRAGDDTETLDLMEAIEALRADPDCDDCRERLRRRLWPLLPAPAPAAQARPAPDAAGEAWLRALTEDGTP